MNHLKDSLSPYLIQHASNPVEWWPWCEEAFRKARDEEKPVFLSIGYSTCHWCHVMERESFEDPEVARLMNETFISIKVDREERPDIDSVYMAVCQMVTGGGGWPLSIIMTSDKKPFFAGTYLPKHSVYGRIGMIDLSLRIREIWHNNRNELLQSAKDITGHLKRSVTFTGGLQPGLEILDDAFARLQELFDVTYAGFGGTPKFPTPHNLRFLLRYWKHAKNSTALEMVERTLRNMRLGGIYDHIGYGFHRYSTDSTWLVPHFEKMLYDQALISIAYIEAYQATGDLFYKKTACEIFSYLLDDMRSPEGGFYSAEDADSEGEEGRFYLFTKREIEQLLSPSDAAFAIAVFNVTDEGNFRVEATGQKNCSNILHITDSEEKLAKRFGITQNQFQTTLEKVRKVLFQARQKRVRPFKDDKILTDWNGLIIAALAKAAKAFNEPLYAQTAKQTLDFILKHLRNKVGRLLHLFRKGRAGITAQIDDYAFVIWGIFELYEYFLDPQLLFNLFDLHNDLINHFWDDKNGGFYLTAFDAENLIVKTKEIYDGAVPSGNSVAFANLIRMAVLTGDASYYEKASKMAAFFQSELSKMPVGYTEFLSGLDYLLREQYEIIIVGDINKEQVESVLRTIGKYFIPNKMIIHKPVDAKMSEQLEKIVQYIGLYKSNDGNTTFYVCKDKQCAAPTDKIDDVMELLGILPR
ncbi:MAG: thioredoxin domain-containing protein [Candidatus Auribacterota bacterium]|nr:thioredoxin domain-containing protein [Candidatus Auribacterota bacterium]